MSGAHQILLCNDTEGCSGTGIIQCFHQAADPKKATPAPAAAAETAKPKEEPKAAAKSAEASVDNKPASVASQAADDASGPKKLEKRNSVQLLFKFLVRRVTLFPLTVYSGQILIALR